MHKLYLSAILDLCDRRIVSFAIRDANDTALVHNTLDQALETNPGDNGPMEGFWGLLKRERYYGRRFTSRAELVKMIREYITYYNFRRLQRGLGVRTPMEVHDCLLAA